MKTKLAVFLASLLFLTVNTTAYAAFEIIDLDPNYGGWIQLG